MMLGNIDERRSTQKLAQRGQIGFGRGYNRSRGQMVNIFIGMINIFNDRGRDFAFNRVPKSRDGRSTRAENSGRHRRARDRGLM
jgi:hypothetical protein